MNHEYNASENQNYIPMKTHTFIISYDSTTKTWSHDIDQEEVHYENGTIYNELTQEWERAYTPYELDHKLCELLDIMLQNANKFSKQLVSCLEKRA
jgi:hypothetical protein